MSEGSPSIEAPLAEAEETLEGNETLAPPPKRRRPTALARGTAIGRYVVIERIGQGGMGVVHVAYDPELDRKVAVKVLVPRGSDEADAAARQRLVREAQAMAKVSHPNVVAVYDVGVHEGRVFVAMELVEGTTLTRWLAAAPRPVDAIVALFLQAGRGLAAAHARGLVHRDFKPDNVMVRDDDTGPRAQVMDFGLVRALGDADVETSLDDGGSGIRSSATIGNRLTSFGQVLGTPSFMAPEQYEPGPVDARADQFSFCVALWEAAFGDHPFGGDDPAELMMRVTRGERPEPPPAARAHPRLRAALDRGLRLDPAERWPSMTELLAELSRDPSRSRRRALVAVAGVAAVGLAVGGERLWHAREVAACERDGARIDETWGEETRVRVREGMLATGLPRAEDTHARLLPWLDRQAEAWREARTQACLRTEVEGTWAEDRLAIAVDCLDERRGELAALVAVLARADQETVDQAVIQAAELPPPWQCTDERYLAHQAAPPADAEARAEHDSLREALAQVAAATSAMRRDEARTRLDALRARLDALDPGRLHVRALELDAGLELAAARFEDAESRQREAFALALELGALDLAGHAAERLALVTGVRLGRLAEGIWWTDVAEGLYRRLGETDDGSRMGDLLLLRSSLLQRQGKLQESLELAERARAIHETSLGADHPGLAVDLERLALLQIDLGGFDAAEDLARRAVDRYESTLGSAHPSVANARHVLADTLRQLGRNEDALAEHRRGLAIREAALPPNHPDIGKALANVGLLLHTIGRSEEALPLLERALAITEASLGSDHVDLVLVLVNLGNVHQSLGQLEAAVGSFQRALTIVDEKLGPEHPNRGVLLVNLGITEILLGRERDAAAHMEQALTCIEAAFGSAHPHVALVLINLGTAYRKLVRLDDALAADRRALELLERKWGPDHPEVAYPLLGLSTTEVLRKRPREALPLAERALAIRSQHEDTVLPVELAAARWGVGHALSESGQDLDRARRLAEQALPVLDGHDPTAVEEIQAFLAKAPP